MVTRGLVELLEVGTNPVVMNTVSAGPLWLLA